jgi:quinol monooxygenase YgiN
MSIVIAGRVSIKADAKEAATERATELATLSRAEEGCNDYRFAFDMEDPNVVLIYEHWESEEALNAHMATPHFMSFTEFIVSVVAGPVDLLRHEVTASRPLFG